MADLSSQTLHLVAKELATTLADARAALEAYADHPDQSAVLRQCAEQLHQAHGALRLVEVYGAALLAEEMEHVTRHLLEGDPEKKTQSDGLDALMRAMVQLPTYLERVMAGGRDLALVLLPLLNDLRAVRGSPLLSEGTLLLLNLKSDQGAQPQPPQPGEAALTVTQWARRLRMRFQLGLLGFIRGERIEENLEALAKVAEKLEQVATTQPVFQLWWVTGAVIEALRSNQLESSVTVKRLLGQADRQIKLLYERGEARYGESPAVDLLNNLLYYVARAPASGRSARGRVGAVQASFKLAELLPVDDSIEQERENLSAPSVKLMHTVAAAIKEDLAKVKDVLDIFVRRGGGQLDELAAQMELLKKISDTLGVLGLGDLRQRVQAETVQMSALVAQGQAPPEESLLKLAAALLAVEDSLDDQLVRLILPGHAETTNPPAAEDVDFRVVTEAVLRECVVNLARVKEAITVAVNKVGDAGVQGLDNVPQLLRGITAGLLMLGKGRAVEIMDAIGVHVRGIVEPNAPLPDPSRLERIADAVVSIEYYMETLQSGRADPWYMLDNAESCLKALALQRTPALPAGASGDAAATVKLDLPQPYVGAAPLTAIHSPGVPGDRVASASAMAAARAGAISSEARASEARASEAAAAPAGIDPELLELFIDEAKDEMGSIRRTFPLWDENPMDVESLTTLRRSFHTLKGSGRMVGARAIGEFAWSIENLLNRLLDKTLSRSPNIMALIRHAVSVLPSLVEQLESGRPLREPVNELMEHAFIYAQGREPGAAPPLPDDSHLALDRGAPRSVETEPAAQQDSIEPAVDARASEASADGATAQESGAREIRVQEIRVQETVATTAVEPQSSEPSGREPMDPVLHEIFSKETEGHLATIRGYLDRRADQPEPHDLPENVYRAIHTLSGSSKMAEARHGIRIAEPLNHYMRKVFDSGHGLSDVGREALADAVASIERVVEHINESTAFFDDQPPLIERLHALEQELDARMAQEERADTAYVSVPAEGAAAPAPPFEADTGNDSSSAGAAGQTGTAEAAVTLPPASRDDETTADSPTEEFDSDIAAIYSEEATELLDAAQASLAAWQSERADKARAAELQRQLHTLKGGARMAGIKAIGDLSHELETLVAQMDAGFLPADDRALGIVQASLDELARMRDMVRLQAIVPSAHGLLARIRALGEGAPEPHLPADEQASDEPSAQRTEDAQRSAAPEASEQDPLHREPVNREPMNREPMTQEQTAQPPSPADTSLSATAADQPAPVLPGREAAQPERAEMARVDTDLLDSMLNNAGEVSIFRARLDQQVNSIDFNLAELARTVVRLKEQLRNLEIETEAQVMHRREDLSPQHADFDPLELDRYSALQQFSRALAETSGDVASIQGLLESLTREAQSLLTQQARVITELQNGLMRTRMVPFQRHVLRLTRLVRQAASETGKRAELSVEGAAAELDRQVLERMVPPLEHMLRNAVVHGIETPDRRRAAGKPDVGRISVSLERDGAEVVLVVSDDGGGINIKLIREKAVSIGLTDPSHKLTDDEAMQLILEPGFSTAGRITQAAGRGVGMDVVATEVKKLGGGLFIESVLGKGSRFTIRLPFTLAISQALIVRAGEEAYALPLATVEGVVRLPKSIISRHLAKDAPLFEYGTQKYRFQQLGAFVGVGASRLPESDVSMSVVLVRAGEHSTALVTDELIGSREIVVKSVGPQISAIRGIAGATILGDGRVVIILDMGALVRSEWRARPTELIVSDARDRRTFALVVDDSITVRRVTQRLLERNGMRVLTAKDGVDAVSLMQEHLPDIILLDIEMPRMDGYEVAAHVRSDARLKDVPIVMITSRVSEKHRARAIELGVNDYLGKPYQENQLLDAIEPLVNRRRAVARQG